MFTALEACTSIDLMTCLSRVMRPLVVGGFDINTTNKRGWSALMFAARNGQEEAARLLLTHGFVTSMSFRVFLKSRKLCLGH